MGLSKLEISESQTEAAISAATSMESFLSESSSKASSLLSRIQGADWEGDSRDSIVAYLSIISQFHEDLYNASKKQTKAFKAITKGISDYEAHGEVAKVKSL